MLARLRHATSLVHGCCFDKDNHTGSGDGVHQQGLVGRAGPGRQSGPRPTARRRRRRGLATSTPTVRQFSIATSSRERASRAATSRLCDVGLAERGLGDQSRAAMTGDAARPVMAPSPQAEPYNEAAYVYLRYCAWEVATRGARTTTLPILRVWR